MTIKDSLKNAGRSILKRLIKIAIYTGLFLYALMGMTAAIGVSKRYFNSRQDIGAIVTLVNSPAIKQRPVLVKDWLLSRPLAETPALIKTIEPVSGKMDYNAFFELARREIKFGNMEEALFWEELALYRQRYDLVRCELKTEQQRDKAHAASKAAMDAQPKEIRAYLTDHPERLRKALERVLAFDALYPAANDPSILCKSFGPEITADLWGGYRPSLRRQLEKYIDELGGKPAPAAPVKAGPSGKPAGSTGKKPE